MNISGSSEKILEFLVNDILDFAQFRAGKFRKNFQNFCLKKSIEEVVKIQQYKADQMGVTL